MAARSLTGCQGRRPEDGMDAGRSSAFASRADPAIRPSLTRGRNAFVYHPGMIRIPEGSSPDYVGEDTGTPVLEECADRMPFRFTGTLKQLAVVLEPLKLSADEQRRPHDQLAEAMGAVQ